jgi:predicted Zn-dependent protease with MMP-like domain
MTPGPFTDEELDVPWALLDEGRASEVLSILTQLDDDDRPHPEAGALTALALCDLGDLDAAERALELAEIESRDDSGEVTNLVLARAEVDLLRWRPEDARAGFERLEADQPSVSTRLRLSLCADLVGDPDGGLEWQRRAGELMDGAFTVLDGEAFDQVVDAAVRELPPRFAARLDDVPVLVEPVPGPGAAGPDVPPDTLGLFRGVSDLEGSFEGFADLPPAIHLYQRNLERRAVDLDELREEIRITLFHELAHLLGFDEDGVDALGLA